MEPLVIIGASARAAAMSARRGGYQPMCADLFADADLAARCPVRRVERYPHGLADAISDYPSAPWLYTGGLENQPALVDRLAAARPLLGNPGHVLRRVRDPRQLSLALESSACRFPDWRSTADGLPRDGSWLRKGYRSAGGLQVEPWTAATPDAAAGKHYFQRRLDGLPAAALYVAARGRSILLGVSEQLLAKYRYAGSMGPLELNDLHEAALADLGERLASEFELTGLFGVDVLLGDDGVYAVDVNPRYPASAEALERAGGFSAVGLHAQACRNGVLPAAPRLAKDACFGKAILFAGRPCVAHSAFTRQAQAVFNHGPWPDIADVPAQSSSIAAGWPVMTVFARADSWSDLKRQLNDSLEQWRQLIGA